MKRTILTLVLASMAIGLFAQEGFKMGLQAGLPIGEFNDQLGVVIGADAGYMWAPNKLLDLGIKVGIIHGFAEKFHKDVVTEEPTSIQFAPVAASVRIWPVRSMSFGIDVGQAFGLNKDNDGGLYYRPQIGFQMAPQTELNFSYTGIKQDSATYSTITMGIVYTFLSARSLR